MTTVLLKQLRGWGVGVINGFLGLLGMLASMPVIFKNNSQNRLNSREPNTGSNKADQKMQAIDYYLIEDDGFGLNVNLMKPYSDKGIRPSQLIFNYRLSRARQVIEVAFGILANRFRCLLNRIHCCPRNARLIVEAAVILHNFLI